MLLCCAEFPSFLKRCALCCWRAMQGRLCPDSRALPTVSFHFLRCSCSREMMGADPAAGGVCSPALRAMRDGCAAQSTICALCAALHLRAGSIWVLCTRGTPCVLPAQRRLCWDRSRGGSLGAAPGARLSFLFCQRLLLCVHHSVPVFLHCACMRCRARGSRWLL